jgi:hypothetical protein
VIFISSTSVYGDANDQTEETPLNPDSEGEKTISIVEGVCTATVVLKLLYFVLRLVKIEIN